MTPNPSYFRNLSIRARDVIRSLDADRAKGNLKIGVSTSIQVYGRKGRYEGEVNEKGEAHGEGTFTNLWNEKFKGTFRANIMDGYCKKTTTEAKYKGEIVDTETTTMGEIKQGFWY